MREVLPARKQRNGTIDFLRFLFALVVVIFHGRKLASDGEFALMERGNLAVEFFFLVSGYLMMRSAARVPENVSIGHETARFLARKIKVVYPSILYAFIPSMIIVISIGLAPAPGESILSSVWEILLLRMSGIKGMTANTITWYISAMLISMLALYPLILKFRKDFAYIIAPLITIFFLGYICKIAGTLARPEKWLGILYQGIMRASAELSLGCICYQVSERLRKVPFTPLARALLTILQWSCILLSLGFMNMNISTVNMSYFCVIPLLAVAITLVFSEISICRISDAWNRVCSWLGRLSLPLYLNHIYVRHIFIYGLKLPYNYGVLIKVFTLAAVAAALVAMYAVIGIQHLFSGKRREKEYI